MADVEAEVEAADLPAKTSIHTSFIYWAVGTWKMISGQSRCHVAGVKGHRSNFENQNFQIQIAD